MANITINSTTNSIQVNFGAYYPVALSSSNGAWTKGSIDFLLTANYVEVNILGQKTWHVSHDGNSTNAPTFQIDLVDAVAPSSLVDLYMKLIALIE